MREEEMAGPSDTPPVTCLIALSGLQILADIGVYHHEIGRPQPLTVNVTLAVSPPARDAVDEVYDYVRIKQIAESLSVERIVLIETFARRIAETCLRHERVLGAAVTIEKPHGVPGAMASATIRIGAGV